MQKEYIALVDGRLGGEDGPFTGAAGLKGRCKRR